eukprot:scaffold11731_cov119-Isochrysis_galbana.AAC.2
MYASDHSAASQPSSQDFNGSTPSRQSGMVQPVIQEMLATMHAAGSSLFLRLKQGGAHSFRIGGATDMADAGGIPPTLIQARGRWASGIYHIYTRDSVEQQFRAADAILRATGEATLCNRLRVSAAHNSTGVRLIQQARAIGSRARCSSAHERCVPFAIALAINSSAPRLRFQLAHP